MRVLRRPWLCAVLAICLLAMSTSAADDTNLPDAASIAAAAAASNDATSAKDTATGAAAAAATDAKTTDDAKPTDDAQNTDSTTDAKPTDTDTKTDAKATDAKPTDTNTDTKTDTKSTDAKPTDTDTKTTPSSAVPTITGSSTSGDSGITGGVLPSISGVYSIVPPSVPPTADAPFMQTSSLPEGTVFIIVGAILGFAGMSVLLWRGIVAWSLHRSVNRIALQQANMLDHKYGRPPAPFYSQYKDHESTHSLAGMGGKGSKKAVRSPNLNAPSTSSLFFSPTAAGAGFAAPGNRGSGYLPSGYYASGQAASSSQVHINGPAISMTNLRPQTSSSHFGPPERDSQRLSRASWAPSPPDSPAMGVRSSTAMKSSSTLNLSLPPGDGRTPSVALDDLLDGEGGIIPGFAGQGNGVRRDSANLGSRTTQRPGTAGTLGTLGTLGNGNGNGGNSRRNSQLRPGTGGGGGGGGSTSPRMI